MVFIVNLTLGVTLAMFLVCLCVLMEYISPRGRYTLRQRIPGFLMQIVGTSLVIALTIPLHLLWDRLGITPAFSVPLWPLLAPLGLAGQALQFLSVLIVIDFLRYWRHRAEHKWFWPIHAVHHAPRELHAASSLGHPLQGIPEFLMVVIPLSFFEFAGPTVPVAVGLVSSLLTVYIHTASDFHFGPARQAVIDNRFHRIHHSTEPRHFDKNFGICFSVWDRMFRTAYWPKPDEWPEVGIKELPPQTVRGFLLYPQQFMNLGARPASARAIPASQRISRAVTSTDLLP